MDCAVPVPKGGGGQGIALPDSVRVVHWASKWKPWHIG